MTAVTPSNLGRKPRSKICRTGRAIHVNDICRMMKRRLKDFALHLLYSPHSFRVTTITDLLEQNVPREDVQHLAGHADPRTTNLYDRRVARPKNP
jgi:integrase